MIQIKKEGNVMGAWGSGLYANDCTSDVRDTFETLLKKVHNYDEAYTQTLQEYEELLNTDEEALLWFALADILWKVGHLPQEVKDKAMYWLANDGGMELWEDSKSGGKGWKKTMEKLQDKLSSPTPPEKKIRIEPAFVTNPWNVGDIYAYQFLEDESKESGLYGKYIALQKIGDEPELYEDKVTFSRIQVFNKVFSHIPKIEELQNVLLLPCDFKTGFFGSTYTNREMFEPRVCMNMVMERLKKRDYQEKRYVFVGTIPEIVHGPFASISHSSCYWNEIEEWIRGFYNEWKFVSYSYDDTTITFSQTNPQGETETITHILKNEARSEWTD